MAQYQTTYSNLVSLLTDYVEDDSSEFSGMVAGAINRAEDRLIRDLDLVIFNFAAGGSTSDALGTLNKGFQDSHVHSILFTAAGEHAQRRSLDYVKQHGGSGRPLYFHEDQTKVYWAPVPDGAYAYELVYTVRPTKLSDSTQTNWLTTNASDALMWAALVESESFLVAPERVAEFEAKYQQMLGPLRGIWRPLAQRSYEPVDPTPTPQQTR